MDDSLMQYNTLLKLWSNIEAVCRGIIVAQSATHMYIGRDTAGGNGNGNAFNA